MGMRSTGLTFLFLLLSPLALLQILSDTLGVTVTGPAIVVVAAAYTVCNNNHGCCNTDTSLQCTTSNGYHAQLTLGSGSCSQNSSFPSSMQLDWQSSGPEETICLVQALAPNQYFQHSEVTCSNWNDQFQVVPVGTTFNPGTVTAAQVPLLALNNYQYCSSVHGCCQTALSSSSSTTAASSPISFSCQVDDGQHISSITIKKNVSECHGQLHVEMDIGDNYFAACLQPEARTGCASVFIHFSTCWGAPEIHRVCPPSCTMQPLYDANFGSCPSSLVLPSNSSCSLICDTGFVPSQNLTTCNADGILNQQICERAPCQAPWPPPSQPLNGSAASCANSLSDMGTCSIQCEPGFVVVGDRYQCYQGVITGGPQLCVQPSPGGSDDPSWPNPLLPMDDSLFAGAPECLRTENSPRVFFMYFGGLPDPMWVALLASSCTLLLSVLVNLISGAISKAGCTIRWQLRWIKTKIWCKRRLACNRDTQFAFAEGEVLKQFLTVDGFYEGLDQESLSNVLARPVNRVPSLYDTPQPPFTTTSLFDICMRYSTHPHLPLPTPLEMSRNFDILYRRHKAVFGPWTLSSFRVFIVWCNLYFLGMYEKYTWALIAGMLQVDDMQRIRSQVELAVKEQGWQADLDHKRTVERIRDLLSISPAVAIIQIVVQLSHVAITAASTSTSSGFTFQSVCEVIFRVFHSGSVNLAATYLLYLLNLRLFGQDLSKFERQQRGVGGVVQDEQDKESARDSVSVSFNREESRIYRVEVPVREHLPSDWFYRVPKQIPLALKALHGRLDKRIRQSALYLPFPKLSLACFIVCIPVLIGFGLPMLLLYAPVFLTLYAGLYLLLLILAQASFACLSSSRGQDDSSGDENLYDPMHAVELRQQLLPPDVDPNSVVLPAAATLSAAAASFDADLYGEELHLWQSVAIRKLIPVHEEEVRRLDACYAITPTAAAISHPSKYVQEAATRSVEVSVKSSSGSPPSYLSSILDPTLPVRLPKKDGGVFNHVYDFENNKAEPDPRRFQHRIIGAPLSAWARDENKDGKIRYQVNAFLVFHFFLARLALSFAVVLTLQCTLDYALLTYTFGPFSPFEHWLPLLQFEFDAHSTSCYFDAVQSLWRTALAFVSRF